MGRDKTNTPDALVVKYAGHSLQPRPMQNKVFCRACEQLMQPVAHTVRTHVQGPHHEAQLKCWTERQKQPTIGEMLNPIAQFKADLAVLTHSIGLSRDDVAQLKSFLVKWDLPYAQHISTDGASTKDLEDVQCDRILDLQRQIRLKDRYNWMEVDESGNTLRGLAFSGAVVGGESKPEGELVFVEKVKGEGKKGGMAAPEAAGFMQQAKKHVKCIARCR